MDGWEPQDINDLRGALADRSLEESTHVEFKGIVKSGAAANVEFARDVASLAISGGRIYVGVVEPEGQPPRVEPIELSGLAERLEQVVATRVTPPLTITSRPLYDVGETGVLIVRVPLSPQAPHMADDRYWRRLDKTKAPLTDVEVRDLIQARGAADVGATGKALDDFATTMPTQPEQGRILVAADPVYGDDELLQRYWQTRNAQRWVTEAVLLGRRPAKLSWSPDFSSATTTSRTGDGWASYGHRSEDGNPLAVVVEFHEDGGIRAFNYRGSVLRPAQQEVGNEVLTLIPQLLVGTVMRTVLLARSVALATNYTSSWDVGVLIEGIDGATIAAHDMFANPSRYQGGDYRQIRRVTGEDVCHAPLNALDQVCGRLIRALHCEYLDFSALLPDDLRGDPV